jgi:hypothetical protein
MDGVTSPPPPWLPPEPPPVGDPLYVEQPYPYPPTQPGAAYGTSPSAYGYPPQQQLPHQPAYGYPSPQWAPPPRRIAAPVVGYGLLAGAVFVIGAAFMPWAQVFGISIDGTDGNGDGNVTLFLGIVIAVMGVIVACSQGRLWTSVVACVAASLVLVTAFSDLTNVSGMADDGGLDPDSVSIGGGLWVTLLAGLLALAFSIIGIARREVRAD